MGDVRFRRAYTRAAREEDRATTIRNMGSEELVMALASTSLERDPLVINILATELQNRVRRSAAAIESIAEGLVFADASGSITYANPTALRLLGRMPHELLGVASKAFVLLDAAGKPIPWMERPVRRALELGETVATREAQLERRDGSRFAVSVLATPIRGEGEILGAVVAFRDITEERRAEARLRFREQLLDALSEAVLATTPEGRITYWNAGATRLYGWAPEAVMGRNIVEVTPTLASREAAEAIMAALSRGQSWSGVFPVRGKDGVPFLAHVTNTPVLDEAGKLVGVIGISRRAETAPSPQ